MAWTVLRLWNPQIQLSALPVVRVSAKCEIPAPSTTATAMRRKYWPHLETVRRRSMAMLQPRKVIPFRYWSIPISSLHRQLYTTPSTHPFDTSNSVIASEEKSLAWRHIYDHSPTSFGISDYWGFLPIIPQGTRLPTKKKITTSNTVPNADFDDFKIQFRHSARDIPIDIIVARLENLWQAERGKTKMKITMEIDKSL